MVSVSDGFDGFDRFDEFDDFYEDPYAIRNKALSTDFYYRDQLQFDQDNLTDFQYAVK